MHLYYSFAGLLRRLRVVPCRIADGMTVATLADALEPPRGEERFADGTVECRSRTILRIGDDAQSYRCTPRLFGSPRAIPCCGFDGRRLSLERAHERSVNIARVLRHNQQGRGLRGKFVVQGIVKSLPFLGGGLGALRVHANPGHHGESLQERVDSLLFGARRRAEQD